MGRKPKCNGVEVNISAVADLSAWNYVLSLKLW